MNDELPRRLPARRGFSVDYRGKALLSTVDPIARAERVVLGASLGERRLYVVESPLLGYGVSKLIDRISEDSAVLCLECDERLFAFALTEMSPDLRNHPRLRMICTRDPGTLCTFVRKEWGPRRFRRVEVLRLGEGSRLWQKDYTELFRQLERDITLDWFNAMTLTRLGRLYALNAIRNLPLLGAAEDLSRLDFGDLPTLVLGAGPSLDPALELLPRLVPTFGNPALRPFRILCVDTALPALRARGIREDLVVALEAQHWNLRDFVGLADGVAIAMDLSALPATAQAAGGTVYIYCTPWTSLRFFDRLAAAGLIPRTLPPLGSVGLTATAIALGAGNGPVLAAGVDFAFRPDAYHAKETPGHKERLRTATRLRSPVDMAPAYGPRTISLPGKNREPVLSDPALRSYRDLFVREFGGNARLYDIGSEGLDLGITRLSPEDAADLLTQSPLRPTHGTAGRVQGGGAKGVADFIRSEREAALRLRNILAGTETGKVGELDTLLDSCDYLWAHFPECAAMEGRRPETSNISFLKRVQAELGPFLKALNRAKEGIIRPWT